MLQTLKQLHSKRAQANGLAAAAAASAAPATASSAVARDLEARNAKLCQLVLNDRGTWVLSEHFDAQVGVWTVDLVRETWDGVWRWQRYRYDRENDALYFWGEQPIDEQALRSLRLRMDERFWPRPATSAAGGTQARQTGRADVRQLPQAAHGAAHNRGAPAA